MKKAGVMLVALLALAACGGGDRNARNYGAGGADRVTATAASFGGLQVRPMSASGPIKSACQRSGRKAANARLCGCVQAVANRSLSSADQQMAVSFYADPHRAQEVRQSDSSRNEAFWRRYKAFGARAADVCKGL